VLASTVRQTALRWRTCCMRITTNRRGWKRYDGLWRSFQCTRVILTVIGLILPPLRQRWKTDRRSEVLAFCELHYRLASCRHLLDNISKLWVFPWRHITPQRTLSR